MSVGLYMDEHVPGPITTALRRRGVDVLTVQDDGRDGSTDDSVLDRAKDLGRVVFTEDQDFLAIATDRQRTGVEFAGIVFTKHQALTYRKCIDDLDLIATAADLAYFRNRIEYLPL